MMRTIKITYELVDPGQLDTKFEKKLRKWFKKAGYEWINSGFNHVTYERSIQFSTGE